MTSLSYIREVTSGLPTEKQEVYADVYNRLSDIKRKDRSKYLWASFSPVVLFVIYVVMRRFDIGIIGVPLHVTALATFVIISSYPVTVFFVHFFYTNDACESLAEDLDLLRRKPYVRGAIWFWQKHDNGTFRIANRYMSAIV